MCYRRVPKLDITESSITGASKGVKDIVTDGCTNRVKEISQECDREVSKVVADGTAEDSIDGTTEIITNRSTRISRNAIKERHILLFAGAVT